MATNKELVEAQAFARRRLVAAFASGAPGGREVEPTRAGRAVVGGLALAVLLLAGAAVASVLAPRTPADWERTGLVVSRQLAVPYVVLDRGDAALEQVLEPILNIASAQLILGADVEPTFVDQALIDRTLSDQAAPGDPIGIAGAPSFLPRTEQLVATGWTACTGDGLGIAVDVTVQRRVTTADAGGVVVRSDGVFWVIARSGELDLDQRGAYRYRLSDDDGADLLLAAIGLDNRAEAIVVPSGWLALFPEGGALDIEAFGIDGLGAALDDPRLPPDAQVGDYILDEGGGAGVFLTREGDTSPLDGFALQVFAASGLSRRLDVALPALPGVERAYASAHWPDGRLDQLRGQVCARLDAGPDRPPRVVIAVEPRGAAVAGTATESGSRRVAVDPGRGALVRAGEANYVIDASGTASALVDEDTLAKLGYDAVEPSMVPELWLAMFDEGVPLSTDQARVPPRSRYDYPAN